MVETAPGRYWIVRKPGSQGNIVRKFDTAGETQIDPIVNHDSFVVQEVADRSALVDKTPDYSELTDEEKEILGLDGVV